VHREGPIWKYVRASMTVIGFLPPILVSPHCLSISPSGVCVCERERDREGEIDTERERYIYIYREREIDRER